MQQVRLDVVQDRLFGQIKADHFGDIRIDRLVVRHTGADRVGERHASGAICGKQSGHTEHRVFAERQRVQKIVVDATIDDMHALRTLGRAHENRVVLNEKIDSLDQLDAHLLGQKRMLEVR